MISSLSFGYAPRATERMLRSTIGPSLKAGMTTDTFGHSRSSGCLPGAKAKGAPGSEILLVKGEKKTKVETDKEAAAGPTLAQLQPAPNGLSAKEEKLNQDAYKELHKRVTDAGLYATPFISGYGPEFVRYSLLALTAALCYQRGWLIPSALFLGLFWQQLTFFAHDLGHVGVTHNWTLDRLISIFIADFIGGLSIGWWVNVSTPHLS